MDHRPLAIGGLSGVASTFLLNLLRNAAQDPILDLPACIPSCLEGASSEDLPWVYFGAGIAVGILVGPLIDLLWLWKQRWRRFIWQQAAPSSSSRALHKVLA